MKKSSLSKAIAMGVLALMLVSLVFSCAAAGNKLIDEYKSVGTKIMEAAKAGDTATVGTLSAQLQTIGQQLSKLKLNKAQQKDIEDFTNKIMQEMLGSTGQ